MPDIEVGVTHLRNMDHFDYRGALGETIEEQIALAHCNL